MDFPEKSSLERGGAEFKGISLSHCPVSTAARNPAKDKYWYKEKIMISEHSQSMGSRPSV